MFTASGGSGRPNRCLSRSHLTSQRQPRERRDGQHRVHASVAWSTQTGEPSPTIPGMTRRATISVLILVGVLVLFGGLFVDDGAYAQGLLLNVGTGMVLFAVLYLIQLRILDRVEEVENHTDQAVQGLSREVEVVRDEVHSAQIKLGELGEQTRGILAEQADATSEAFDAFRDDITCETTVAILDEGVRVRGVSRNGVRVEVPNSTLWLRFNVVSMEPVAPDLSSTSASGNAVWLALEEIGGTRVGDFVWERSESATETMVTLAQRLQQLGAYPGGESFSPDDIFSSLQRVLKIAVGARTRSSRYPADLGPLIEVPNQQWAITEAGLECLERRYVIPRGRLDEPWGAHMATKPWIDMDQFDWAFTIAQALLPRQHERPPRPGRPVETDGG